MSVQGEIARLNNAKTALKEAIVDKGVAVDNTATLDEYASLVRSIPSGSPDVIEKDVNFWDYDGTLLYSYTLDEIRELTELPPAPTPKHDFLEFQKWNWTLEGIKTYMLPLDVGAIWKPSDGATRLFVNFVSDDAKKMELYINQSESNGVTIDWGDGTSHESVSGAGAVSVSHEYAAIGDYVIAITPVSGTFTLGWNDGSVGLCGVYNDDHVMYNRAAVTQIYVGESVSVGSYAFSYFHELVYISLSENCTLNGIWALGNTTKLRHVNFPASLAKIPDSCVRSSRASVVSAGENTGCGASVSQSGAIKRTFAITANWNVGYAAFGYSSSLRKIVIFPPVKNIGGEGFARCVSVATVELHSDIRTIAASSFANMYSLKRLCFRSTTPPTVANANAFSGIPTSCVVEVPAASLDAYKNATNYSGIAAQMVGV